MRWILMLFLGLSGLCLWCSNLTSNAEITQEMVSADKILKNLQKGEAIYLTNAVISGDLDLTQLPGQLVNLDYYVTVIDAQITFVNCEFKGKVLAYRKGDKTQHATRFTKGLSFIECTFRKEFNFKGSVVDGLASFPGTYFEEAVHFETATFRHDANFSKSIYMRDLYFQECRFAQAAQFMNANIGGIANFQGCTFGGDAQFGVAEFHAYADFSRVSFQEGVFLDYTKFHDRAVFSNVLFKGRMDLKGGLFEKDASFKGSLFYGKTRFFQSTFDAALDLSGTTFMTGQPDMNELNLKDQKNLDLNDARVNQFQPLELTF
ncbi:MAG TPA: pentapeptide repeat-containing protein [Saprospiraceae bacterium]|nr:pentapeptide repeat-containing protein [Saprospiraceae bacterium]HMQ81306.1 pentapeptide repeat-containing protein [Saprospiraceae bacterium]